MIQKLSSLLSVMTLTVSFALASYLLIGYGIFYEFLAISVIAWIGWIKYNVRREAATEPVVAPYILSIALVLAVDSTRFMSDFASRLLVMWPQLFVNDTLFTTANWFLIYVSFLVSVFLFGGYLLIKDKPEGFYIAWWLFVYNLFEAILQIYVEFCSVPALEHYYFSGTILACAAAVTGIVGGVQLTNKAAGKARGEQ